MPQAFTGPPFSSPEYDGASAACKLEESIFNIGAATIVGSILEEAEVVDRGPLANAAAHLVDEGRVGDAAELLDANAIARRTELLAAARVAPAGMSAAPMAGECLSPISHDGDIVAIDPFGYVQPGQIVVYKFKEEPFNYAKVLLGISNCEAFRQAFNFDRPCPLAVFWMANPPSFILASLADIEYIARIDGHVDPHGWYSEFERWSFTEEEQKFIEHFGDSIKKRPPECFGCPPLARKLGNK